MANENIITRSNTAALVPEEISRQILQQVPERSTFLSLAQRMPDMTSKQLRIPVLQTLVQAGFVNGDIGNKPVSNMSWDKVYIDAEELAVIVPIPEAVLDDTSYDIWGEVRPRIVEAFGKAIDQAAFFGVGKPAGWGNGLVQGAIAAGNVVTLGASDKLYSAIAGVDGVLAKVEEQGMDVDAYVGALKLRAKLRGEVDAAGQPIFRTAYSNGVNGTMAYELEGAPIHFPKNGAWDDNSALLLAGDFSYARYAMRQDITYKILDQATLTDGEGKVTYSLAQQDMVALRAVMRLGWALPRPVNAISGTTYYPFAVLQSAQG